MRTPKAIAEAEVPPTGWWATVRCAVRAAAVGLTAFHHYGRRTPVAELGRWCRALGPAARLVARLPR